MIYTHKKYLKDVKIFFSDVIYVYSGELWPVAINKMHFPAFPKNMVATVLFLKILASGNLI